MKKAQRNIPGNENLSRFPKGKDPNIVSGPQGPGGPPGPPPNTDCGLSPDQLALGWTCVDGIAVKPRSKPDMDFRDMGVPKPPPVITPMKKGGRVKMKNGGNVPGMYNGRF